MSKKTKFCNLKYLDMFMVDGEIFVKSICNSSNAFDSCGAKHIWGRETLCATNFDPECEITKIGNLLDIVSRCR